MKKKYTSMYVPLKAVIVLLFIACQVTKSRAQGNALNFDGANDHVIIGPAAGLYTAGSAYTKEAWVLSLGSGFAGNLVSSSDPFFLEFDDHIHASNAYIINVQEPHDVIDPQTMVFNRWTHMAVTYDGVSTMKLYRNGQLVNTNTAVSFASLSGQNFIGAFLDETATPNYIFNGTIDEVRIYNIALTQANIKADMVSSTSSVPGNLLAYYNFDAGTAGGTNTGVTSLTDVSGHGQTGTLNNFALTGGTSNWVSSYSMIISDATPASSVTNVSFSANWTVPVTGGAGMIDQYAVEVATSADFSTPITGSPFSVPFGTNTFSVTGLTPNVTYYYRVWADKGFSNVGAYSNTVSVTTLITLPVNSLTFNVSKSSGNNLLQWSTGGEQNTNYFEVQQSTNGKDFKTIAVVNASGNSSTTKNYQYVDNLSLVQAPVYYYRLKMVDINGNFTYSTILISKNAKGSTITVYPNPTPDKVIINVTDKALMNTTAQLSDISGKLLQNVPIIQTVTILNISKYEKGVYLLRLANGESVKLVKE